MSTQKSKQVKESTYRNIDDIKALLASHQEHLLVANLNFFSQLVMVRYMFGLAFEKLKILYPIIIDYFVNMMYYFSWLKKPTQIFFQNKAVLINILFLIIWKRMTRLINSDISRTVNHFTTFPVPVFVPTESSDLRFNNVFSLMDTRSPRRNFSSRPAIRKIVIALLRTKFTLTRPKNISSNFEDDTAIKTFADKPAFFFSNNYGFESSHILAILTW